MKFITFSILILFGNVIYRPIIYNEDFNLDELD